MKKIKLLGLTITAIACATGCAGPGGFQLGRMFPDGSNGRIDKATLTVSMTGAGSLVIEGVQWSGTNGFPFSGSPAVTTTSTTLSTNVITTK